jgi:hypothetical protein
MGKSAATTSNTRGQRAASQMTVILLYKLLGCCIWHGLQHGSQLGWFLEPEESSMVLPLLSLCLVLANQLPIGLDYAQLVIMAF